MPYPNEHAARVREPGEFIPDSMRRKEVAPGISLILGKLTATGPNGSMTVQAYRFDKDKFTPDEARAWLKEHDVDATLEPASDETKHHVDSHIGGRPDPEEIKTEDYVIPDERRFPITAPIDVHDAVHAWGSYHGVWTYEQFKSRLTSIAVRKGRNYVAALPASWRKELEERKAEPVEKSILFRGEPIVRTMVEMYTETAAPPSDETPDSDAFTVKAAGDWELDILAVPFGDAQHKDAQGEWFTAETEYHEDKFGSPPLVYYHGMDDKGKPTGEPQYIGKTIKRWITEKGIWFRGVLDKANEFAKRVWDAAVEGKARASTGSIAHLVRTEANGRIVEWPIAELSVFDLDGHKRPANPYAVAVPAMRAVYEAAGIALPLDIEAPEVAPEAAQAAVQTVSATTKTEPQATQGDTNMEPNEFEAILTKALGPLQAKLEAVVADVDKIKAEPPAAKAAGIAIMHDEADTPFSTLADQCLAVKSYELSKGRRMHPRLSALEHVDAEEMRATKQTGANEGVPAMGGFLLEPTLGNEFLKPLHEEGPFTRLCRKLPVGTNSNYGWINGVDETSRANGSRWGGIRGYRLAEAGAKTASHPEFRRINWELKKYAVLVYATDELLQDAAMFSAIVTLGAAEELAFMANDDILTGNGAGGPFGILQSGALVTVAIEAGQLADTVVNENLEHMWEHLLPGSRPKAAWFINSEVEPFLDMLLLQGGTGVLEPRFVSYGPEGILRIKGRPVYVTEFNSAIGVVGDIVLADMSEYLFWEKGGVQSAQSIHVAFLTDETIFRFVYRCDGQPSVAAPITPYRATAGVTQSPFVTLAAR